MKKALLGFFSFLTIIAVVYILGPKVPAPQLNPAIPNVPAHLTELEEQIRQRELSHPSIKPGNEARIIWADSIRKKTEYSLVFLPGFTATQAEADPIHLEFGKRYGCNLYLARLYAHGLDTADNMIDLTADKYLQSAGRAIAIGKAIGEKVIVMSSSTGGTLALYLAAHHPEIHALICYSPNVEIYDPNAKLLTKPWGLQIARLVTGGDFRQYEAGEDFKKHWTTKYRIEAIIAVQNLVEHTMTEATFEKIEQPLFLGYYYKNEVEQDKVVSVDAMLNMFNSISTPEDQKRKMAFPGAGRHVLSSRFATKDYTRVREETFRFAEQVLGLQAH